MISGCYLGWLPPRERWKADRSAAPESLHRHRRTWGQMSKMLKREKRCWRSSPACQVTVLYDHPVALLHPRLNCGQDHLLAVLVIFHFHSYDQDLSSRATLTCSMTLVRHRISRLPPSPCCASNIITHRIFHVHIVFCILKYRILHKVLHTNFCKRYKLRKHQM